MLYVMKMEFEPLGGWVTGAIVQSWLMDKILHQ